MKREVQINNLIIYKSESNYIVKAPDGSVVFSSIFRNDVVNWCKNNRAYLKREVRLNKVDSSLLINNVHLVHGSDHIVDRPKYGVGSSDCDYGRGFYCVEDKNVELAKEWACSRYNKTGVGYINFYSIDLSDLNILYLNDLDIIYWVCITTKHRKLGSIDNIRDIIRKYYIDVNKYDIIVGWRCDDNFSDIINRFIDGGMTAEAIAECVKLGYLQNQVVLKSKLAFSKIKFVKVDKVENFNLYYRKFETRLKNANAKVRDCIIRNRIGKYITDY